LHSAAFWGQTEIAKLLLDNGAQIGAKRESGQGDLMTPLHLAAMEGYTSLVSLFLERGATVDAENNRGLTPLLLFLQHQGPIDEGMVSLLLQNGADARKADRFQNTSLHWAASGNSPNIVTRLLAAGASLSERNRQGLAPLDIAIASGNHEVVKILREHGAVVAKNYQMHSPAPAQVTLRTYNGGGNVLGRASGKFSFEKPPGRQKIGLTLNWEGGTTLGLTQRAIVSLSTVFFVEPGHNYLIDVNAGGRQEEVHAIIYEAITRTEVARLE
jgi:ankyrin repeat protein